MIIKYRISRKPYIALAAVMCFISALFCRPGAPNDSAIAVFVSGAVERSEGRAKTGPLLTGDELRRGDVISTGPKAFAVLQIGDEILLRIQADTAVEMKTLHSTSGIRLYLRGGQLITCVGKLMKNGGYAIETPTALASVRGTSYSISYYKDRSVLAVREGKVLLTTRAGGITRTAAERMVEMGGTLIIDSKLAVRPVNEFETLEIEKLTGIPLSSPTGLKDTSVLANLARKAGEDEQRLQKEIIARGGPVPRTMEEMKNRFGRINEVILYNNRRYTGVILSYGKTVKIMTLDGIVDIPLNKIRSTRR